MRELLKTFDLVPFDLLMIGIGATLFVIYWKALSKVLFDPFMKLLESREASTEGAVDEAAEIKNRAAALSNTYNEKISAVRITSMEERLKKTGEARKKAQEIIDKAEGHAQEQVRKVRWEIQQNISTLREDALKNSESLASLVVSRIEEGGSVR